MSASSSAAKKPRPMYSGSPSFEAGYAEFMKDVFDKDVRPVETSETDQAKIVTICGSLRILLDKKDGLLRAEHLEPVRSPAQSPEVWKRSLTFPISSFWLANSEVLVVLQQGWSNRIKRFVPSAEESFPTAPPKSKGFFGTAKDRKETAWSSAIQWAARRRLKNASVSSKVLVSALWNFLVDRETLRLCHAYFGRKASLDDYNYTVRLYSDLAARAQETPNVTPLIGAYLKKEANLLKGHCPLPLDVLARAKKELFPLPGRDGNPLPYIRPQDLPLFEAEALAPAAWRFLASSGRNTVEHIWRLAAQSRGFGADFRGGPGPAVAPILSILAVGGQESPLSFIKWIIPNIQQLSVGRLNENERETARENVRRFIRLASQQACVARKKGALKKFISGDLLLALDWLKNKDTHIGAIHQDGLPHPVQATLLPKNATWASIMRSQHRWHAEREVRERERLLADRRAYREHVLKQDAISWESAISADTLDDVVIEPLTTGEALRLEGERMGHCVGGYISVCKAGTSRIFSLKSQEGDATVELVEAGSHKWHVRQVFGPKNAPAPLKLIKVAKTLAMNYSKKQVQMRASK